MAGKFELLHLVMPQASELLSAEAQDLATLDADREVAILRRAIG